MKHTNALQKSWQIRLLYLVYLVALSKFVKKSRDLDIAVGLAGKLKTKQIPQLLKLRAKVIGFRSAVCEKNDRRSLISENKTRNIYSIFNRLLIEQHNKQAYVG